MFARGGVARPTVAAARIRGARPLRFIRLGFLFALAVTLASVVAFFPGVARAADQNGCQASIDNPHYSGGAAGIIAKGNWLCSVAPATIYLHAPPGGFLLFLCPTQPPKNEDWIAQNCTQKGINTTDFTISTANQWNVRYVPPLGQPGAHGTGWWIACAMWSSGGYNGTSPLHTTFSNLSG
jgi:hypothetical protein